MSMKNLTKIQRYLLWASFIGTFAEQMITPLYGIFVKQIGGDIMEAGLGFSVFYLVTGACVIYTGNKKWFQENTHIVVTLGFLLSGIGDFSYYWVTSPYSLLIVNVIIGISVGLLNPAWDSIYESEGEEGDEHFRWILWSGGVSISVGISALIGSLMANYFGFRSMFILSGVINSFAVYFSILVYRERK